MPSPDPPALSVQGLVKLYRTSQNGVRGLNMTVPQGTVHGFLGRNGAGKTTTMKCLAGLLRMQQGTVHLFGESYDPRVDARLRLRIGYSPELPSFPAHLRVRELLELYGRMRGLDSRGVTSETRYLAERLGLQEVVQQKFKTLSKGNQARVGVAVAMLGDPDLIILDEPTSGLDPVAVAELRTLLLGLAQGSEGPPRTILLSSHQLGEAQRLCSGVTIIDGGGTVAEGPVGTLIERISGGVVFRAEFKGATERLFAAVSGVPGVRGVSWALGTIPAVRVRVAENVDPREALARLALQHGALLLSCEREQVSLEDLFLAFVGRKNLEPELPPSASVGGSGAAGPAVPLGSGTPPRGEASIPALPNTSPVVSPGAGTDPSTPAARVMVRAADPGLSDNASPYVLLSDSHGAESSPEPPANARAADDASSPKGADLSYDAAAEAIQGTATGSPRIEPSAPAAVPLSRRPCPFCGGWNDSDFAFCQRCGKRLPPRPEPG